MFFPVAFFLLLNDFQEQEFIDKLIQTTAFAVIMILYVWTLGSVASFHLLKPTIKSNVYCTICSIVYGVAFPVTIFFILGWYFIIKRLYLSMLFLCVAFIMALLQLSRWLPAKWYYGLEYGFLLNVIIYFFIAMAIVVATKAKPIRRTAVAIVPALIGIVSIVLLLIQYHQNQFINQALRQQISRKLGSSVLQEDFQKNMERGVDYNEEPLASFMKATFQNPDAAQDISQYEMILTFDKEKKDLLTSELNEKNSEYEKAVLAFTSSKPQKIAHKHDWANESACSILLPELSKLQGAGKFLMMQILVSPQNKEIVTRNNASMTSIRDWALNGDTLISMMVGIAIESRRIKALCCTLPYIEYTEAEWEQLLGIAPDWNRLIANVYGYELGFYENVKNYCLKYAENSFAKKILQFDTLPYLPKNICALWFEIDNGCALRYFKRSIELSLETIHDYNEINKTTDSMVQNANRRFLVLSAMLLPAISKSVEKIDSMKDLRRMASLARMIVEYKKKNGTFPESLEKLSDDCRDSLYRDPFLFETQNINAKGFKISTHYSLKNYILVPF
ncbi:MAG: hypothetical protein J6X55_08850 [Victivallales bacterium]|nr:hypothetical protein [Victivallales bacterium]